MKPPSDTDEPRAARFVHDEEELLVFSFPLDEAAARAPLAQPWQSLSSAELEVVTLAIEGRSNAEIAQLRGTAVRTAAKQLETAYRRLGVNSRRELAVLAARLRGARRRGE